jgi:alpha-mannosidase
MKSKNRSKAATSTTPKQKCFLVCTAHLDPVWLWPWEEGLSEAISTYRVAADFLDQYPDFIFNHNESVLYEWVERNDPRLFKRIQKHVKNGRWAIAGGSYIQPDVIAASGESLIRQFLVAKTYFMEKFGVDPTTAYNFDSFGHSQGYIQIMQGCGFDSYVFCRPHISVLPLPVGSFVWKHKSGAEILGRRSDDHYITQGAILQNMVEGKWGEYHKSEGDFLFLWGLGNHGGGPSHAEYADLKKLSKAVPDVEFIESSLDGFFQHTQKMRKRKDLPVVTGDFKPVQEGCYTSMAEVKRRHREMENMIHLVEKFAAIAWFRGQRAYPTIDLQVAWKDILFSEFHDILPGSGIQKAESDAFNMLGHCEEILRRKRAESLISQYLDEPLADRNETPLFVYNPHSWEVTQEVVIDYGTDAQYGPDGETRTILLDGTKIDAQFEKADENLMNPSWGGWRRKAVFSVTVPPMSYQRFGTEYKILPKDKIQRWQTPPLPAGDVLTLQSRGVKVEMNLTTGLLDGITAGGEKVVLPGSCLPQVYADINHSWSTITEWQEPVSVFKLATPQQTAAVIGSAWTHRDFPDGKPPISILEDGPVRTVVQAIFVHGSSYLVQKTIVNKKRPVVHIEQTIFWGEHDRMLRWEMNHDPAYSRIEAEKAYSIDDDTENAIKPHPYYKMDWYQGAPNAPLAADSKPDKSDSDAPGQEMDYQHFLRFSKADGKKAFAVISHGTHSYRHRPGLLRLGILRSPSYGTHDHIIPTNYDQYLNRYIPRQDQGIRYAKFTLLFGDQATSTDAVARASYEASVPLDCFIYFPTNPTKKAVKSRSFASVSAPNVLITSMKKAENEKNLVIRLWETGGQSTRFTLVVEGKKYPLSIGAWQLKTILIGKHKGKLTEADMLERPLKK